MRSTLDVEIDELIQTVATLNALGIKVIGSASGDGVVCLAIEGDIVPDVPKVGISTSRIVGSQYVTLTARCQPA